METSKIRACRNTAGTFPRNMDDEAVLFLNDAPPKKHVAQALVFLNGQRGFTLIELMIGLALGLIASLAIFSTITTFEAQRRTTGSGVDMQQNGLMALYSIEQDMRMAGFGLIDPSPFPGSMPCIQVNGANIAPVTITDVGNGSDSITMHRLDSDIGGIVTGGQAAKLTSNIGAAITVDTRNAIHTGDYLLIPDAASNCTQIQATVINPAVVPGPSNINVINLGSDVPAFSTLQYRINSNNLQHSVDNGTSWNDLASNIVNMQAQYGVANAGTQPVSCWTDATGSACSGTDWANPSAADVARIKAIRVSIVARSAQKAACTTTTAAPISWVKPSTTPASSNAPQISLSTSVGQDWQCYRYKVYQTIIPIRNVILGNLT